MAGILNADVDLHVVKALMRGDSKAQEQVYRLLSVQIFTMAKRILNNQQSAEEVTQDTFVDVLTKAETLRSPEAFTSWVRTVAVNHCYMRMRSPWHQRRDQLEVVVEATDEQPLDQAVDVAMVLSKLKNPGRMIVWLYCVEGYTHEEIASLFDKTISFSKSQLSRAFDALDVQRMQSEVLP